MKSATGYAFSMCIFSGLQFDHVENKFSREFVYDKFHFFSSGLSKFLIFKINRKDKSSPKLFSSIRLIFNHAVGNGRNN